MNFLKLPLYFGSGINLVSVVLLLFFFFFSMLQCHFYNFKKFQVSLFIMNSAKKKKSLFIMYNFYESKVEKLCCKMSKFGTFWNNMVDIVTK